MSEYSVKMITKFILLAGLTLSFLFSQPGIVMADDSRGNSTPYGDFCRKYSHYGKNRIMHDYKHAEKALIHYYSKKGLEIKPLSRKGRFIKANVIKKGIVIDIILFDRHTGRVRSIY